MLRTWQGAPATFFLYGEETYIGKKLPVYLVGSTFRGYFKGGSFRGCLLRPYSAKRVRLFVSMLVGPLEEFHERKHLAQTFF